jgi:hypothetical protein
LPVRPNIRSPRDWIGAVPQREREAELLAIVADTGVPSSPQRYARERA